MLIAHLQTEPALHTNVAISDARQDFASTHALVSDIRHAVVKGQEVAAGGRLVALCSSLNNFHPCLDSSQVCNFNESVIDLRFGSTVALPRLDTLWVFVKLIQIIANRPGLL